MNNKLTISSLALSAAAIFILLAMPSALYAHGVVWQLSGKKVYGFEFSYDDESPMGFAEIKVFGPDDSTKLSQTGRTDKNGYFAFIPDAEGQWLVAADDGAGHLAKAELAVALTAEGGGASAAESAGPSVNMEREIGKATKPLKMGLVVSIFLNLALVAMVNKRKKSSETK